jgi:uncharacterized repeat protein (TIGR01451 family)
MATGAEVTVKNDSLTAGGTGSVVAGFVPGEKAASWLTSPCAGNIRAAQIFWRSPSGTSANVIGAEIEISRAGTFPTPGTLADTIGGPVLTDGVINEYRYKDENNTIPLIVPVQQGETFVVSFTFDSAPVAGDPSVVRDTDGIQSQRNGLCADFGGASCTWFDSSTLGVTGDWVIRAVIDCASVPVDANVSVAMTAQPQLYTPNAAFGYTITVANAGPANSPNTTVVDIFPAAYTGVTWTCTPSGGASCVGGSGNITGNANLPSGSQVVYSVSGTVAPGTTGTLTNSATAVVNSPANDPSTTNNTATVNSASITDRIFANGFDS